MANRLRTFVLITLIVAIGAGIIALLTLRPAPAVITLIPPVPSSTPVPTATPEVIRVFVSGAVVNPGVTFTLRPGSRAEDAIQAAGGFTLDADVTKVNLASFVSDGQRIDVPFVKGAGTGRATAPAKETPSPNDKVRINRADTTELQRLPGVGPSIAARIIDYRNKNGPFRSLDDLDKVTGIGQSRLDQWRELISFEP